MIQHHYTIYTYVLYNDVVSCLEIFCQKQSAFNVKVICNSLLLTLQLHDSLVPLKMLNQKLCNKCSNSLLNAV